MQKWEIKKVTAKDLESTLNGVPAPWEVFDILPYGDDFLVVCKRP